ncbi:MAG: isochorismate synthase [Xenococcaceae cyanobacterium MO_207.B15]|nr:isochorismate synthase [Xenococcaceae cyanobacterium MO_207.B15]
MTQSNLSLPLFSQENKFILDSQKLDKFWDNQPLSFTVTEKTKVISFIQKIPVIDPLAFLQKVAYSKTLHFYWENPSKQEAIAAYGVTRKLAINSLSRFEQGQQFIQSCFQQTIMEGETTLAGNNPYIFCSFTFFPDSDKDTAFPAATVFLPRFQIFKKHKNCFFIVNYPLESSQEKKPILAQLPRKINSIDWSEYRQLTTGKVRVGNFDYKNKAAQANPEPFKSIVISALDSIAKDEFSKIVIANATDVSSPVPFKVINSLNNLRSRHPDCYIFSTSNGQGKNFIGASPERLVSIQNQQLVTDALAGSAPRGKNTTEDVQLANLLLKSRKEKREHQAVSKFLIQRLQQMGLKPYQLPLQLLQLSNIQHLWTPIYAHLPKDIHPLEIVDQLHPTPAVAGVPSEIACAKIRHYEQFDRSLYAAPLGWIDNRGNCEFIVGIRSALIEKNHARLYAGAGIVSGSNPDKEFVEIQLKLQSLLKALV